MPDESDELGARLRALRLGAWDGLRVTQKQLSQALGLSGALLSSWENGTTVPPEDRLHGYARFFATRRSIEGKPRLLPDDALTADEKRTRQSLIDELIGLRELALSGGSPISDTGALGGKFWYFSDGQPITILCTPFSSTQLGAGDVGPLGDLSHLPPAVQYTMNRSHPNAVRNTRNGDIDALIELVGHIRAENPLADVTWRTYDRITNDGQLTGHLVILGGGDPDFVTGADAVSYFRNSLKIPLNATMPEGGDPEFDGYFEVMENAAGIATYEGHKREKYAPRFILDESLPGHPRLLARGVPQLASDVAIIARKPNPLNTTANVTWLSGMFSRGTYGAVRAFTDAQFRSRNEVWLAEATKPDDFWMLIDVTVFNGERTITPDLSLRSTRRRMSS